MKIHKVVPAGESAGNTSAEESVKALKRGWRKWYGRPDVMRSDPEGCFRGHEHKAAHEAMGIAWDPDPAEAYWRHGAVDSCIGVLKDKATAECQWLPDNVDLEDVFDDLTAAENERQGLTA